jgi:Mrp family chromosome partitioning ATPase
VLREQFDIVVLDGAASRERSATLGLARFADAALVVVRRGRTTRRRLDQLVTDLDQVDVGVAGVALLKAERGRPPKQRPASTRPAARVEPARELPLRTTADVSKSRYI